MFVWLAGLAIDFLAALVEWLGPVLIGLITRLIGWFLTSVVLLFAAWLAAQVGILKDIIAGFKGVFIWLMQECWTLFFPLVQQLLNLVPSNLQPDFSSVTDTINLVNKWVPLQEGAVLFTSLYGWYGLLAMYRFAKSWIPTVSGSG